MIKNLNKKLFLKLLEEVYQSGEKFPELNAQDEWYLDIIRSADSISSSELASLTGVTKSAITPVTKKLERDGYIVKQQSKLDRRTYNLSLSSDIEKKYRKIEANHGSMFDKNDALTDEELRQLRKLIKKLI